jgi:hypothetical protein
MACSSGGNRYAESYYLGNNLQIAFAAFVKPYIFSVLPPGAILPSSPKPSADPSGTQPAVTPTTVVQIRSSISLLPTQTLSFPFTHPSSSTSTLAHPPTTNATVRLLTPSASSKSPLFLVTTPTDKAAATAEGSTIWQFKMKSWDAQIDELVVAGQYSDALALLDTIDPSTLGDKVNFVPTLHSFHSPVFRSNASHAFAGSTQSRSSAPRNSTPPSTHSSP